MIDFPYVESFEAEDRERFFRFLVLFARWESALKHHGFARRGCYGQAEPDWNRFVDQHEMAIEALKTPEFASAPTTLERQPPKREECTNGSVEWRDNPRRPTETKARSLFRIVRDVRNNLFHGGKFLGQEETAREIES